MTPTRRGLLAGSIGLTGAAALEAASLTGRFDHRRRIAAHSNAQHRCGEPASQLGVTHIGQSTHLIHLGDKRVLTDPWFRDPAFGTLTHDQALGCAVESLLPDIICITHDHPDHADVEPLDVLPNKANTPCFVHDASVAHRLRAIGFRDVNVMKAGDRASALGIQIDATDAVHDVSEIGFVFDDQRSRVYFAGDTREHAGFAAIGERYKLDLAILPVDGTGVIGSPRAVMGPKEAIAALGPLRPRAVMPTHADAIFSDLLARYVLSTTVENARQQFGQLMQREARHVKLLSPAPGETVLLPSS